MCVVSTTMVHFLLIKVFETYQVYYAVWLIHKGSITIFFRWFAYKSLLGEV